MRVVCGEGQYETIEVEIATDSRYGSYIVNESLSTTVARCAYSSCTDPSDPSDTTDPSHTCEPEIIIMHQGGDDEEQDVQGPSDVSDYEDDPEYYLRGGKFMAGCSNTQAGTLGALALSLAHICVCRRRH